MENSSKNMNGNNEKSNDSDVVVIKSDPDVVEIRDENGNDDDICELEHLRKLFIGGLSLQTTEQSLKAYYSQWGKVVDVVVMRDPVSKRSRGFGFITYTKSSSVNTAQENRPHIIDGKAVEAKRALPRPERENRETNVSVKKLFVGGLKDNHDEESLREYFSQFGNVISIKILTDRVTGKRRGFAFIEFDDYDAVDKAILKKQHSIKYVIVDVKKSVYKQENKQQAEDGSDGFNLQNRNNMQNHNNLKATGPAAKPVRPYQMGPMTPQQHRMPYHQPAPPMNGCPPGPPPNYNYWGPPPPMQGYSNGYQQPPPAAPMNNWNNGWNAGPPPQAPGAWQHWGYPPAGMPPPPPVSNASNWNAQVPLPGSAPVPQQAPAPPQPPIPPTVPQNFGTGYQQNYGGGPVKHNGTNGNRMNPYSVPPNNYVNGQAVPPVSYGGYAAPPAVAKAVPPVAPVPVGKYRR